MPEPLTRKQLDELQRAEIQKLNELARQSQFDSGPNFNLGQAIEVAPSRKDLHRRTDYDGTPLPVGYDNPAVIQRAQNHTLNKYRPKDTL